MYQAKQYAAGIEKALNLPNHAEIWSSINPDQEAQSTRNLLQISSQTNGCERKSTTVAREACWHVVLDNGAECSEDWRKEFHRDGVIQITRRSSSRRIAAFFIAS